jgi:hypothetical protein
LQAEDVLARLCGPFRRAGGCAGVALRRGHHPP